MIKSMLKRYFEAWKECFKSSLQIIQRYVPPPPNFFLILHSCLHYEDENVQEQIFFLILDEMHQGVVSILHSQF